MGMQALAGFGVNYKAKQSNWDTDIAYFKAIGVKYIRPNMCGLPSPWKVGAPSLDGTWENSYAFWRNCAQYFHSKGFWVAHGPSGVANTDPVTTANWNTYRTAVLAEAKYLQSINYKIDAWEIGNEIGGRTTMSASELNQRIRQLAVDVKKVYTLSPLSYGPYDAWLKDAYSFDEWAQGGLGGLDKLGIHTYGEGLRRLKLMTDTFGDKIYVGETGLDGSNPAYRNVNESSMTTDYLQKYLAGKNVPFMVYQYCGLLNGNNDYSMVQSLNGSYNGFNPVWWSFFTGDKVYPGSQAPVDTNKALQDFITAANKIIEANIAYQSQIDDLKTKVEAAKALL